MLLFKLPTQNNEQQRAPIQGVSVRHHKDVDIQIYLRKSGILESVETPTKATLQGRSVFHQLLASGEYHGDNVMCHILIMALKCML